jgi:hypothetical protein
MPKKVPTKYPVLDKIAMEVANAACITINERIVTVVKSKMPYKAQYTLEQVIKILEERV